MINGVIQNAERKAAAAQKVTDTERVRQRGAGDGAWYPRGKSAGSDRLVSSPNRRSGDGAYHKPTKTATNSKQIQASDLKSGDRVIFGQQAKTVSSVGMQKNGKVGISFTTGGVTDLRPDQTLPRAAPAKSPRVRVNQSGRAGKFIVGTNKLSPSAYSPNNPRNWTRHPDSDKAQIEKGMSTPATQAAKRARWEATKAAAEARRAAGA
jgi:hypothetical protein